MNEQTIRLPEWKACLEDMLAEGIAYGKVYPAEFFEEKLRQKRDSMKFGLDISEIRRALETRGFYLSGRGQKGSQFVVLPPSGNADVMCAYQRAAIDALKRGVILGTNTRLDSLSEGERRRHEQILERMAVKMALMSRSKQAFRVVNKANPKLLKSDAA